eukprot:1145029-Pelagomonas_calceolata.AAC.4
MVGKARGLLGSTAAFLIIAEQNNYKQKTHPGVLKMVGEERERVGSMAELRTVVEPKNCLLLGAGGTPRGCW